MKRTLHFITALVAIFYCFPATAQITVNTSANGLALANALVGPGVMATNVTVQNTSLSTGTFTNAGTTGFSFTDGIILSTGELNHLNDPASYHNSTQIGLPGNSLIDAIVAPSLSQDAVSLDFDFTCASDSVEFEFVFSSEEYNDYSNTNFIDAFGFFVTGPGYAPNTNMALIPGTNIPISINTINNGNSSGISSGPCLNCAYFVDNVNTNAVSLSPDGFTVPIKIKFAVMPCTSYHFTLVISDVSDAVFDSQVYLKGESFLACPNMQATMNGVPAAATQTICAGGSVTLSAPDAPSYLWSTGETTQSITVTQPGLYSFLVNSGTCFAYSSPVTLVQQGTIQTPVITQNGPVLNSSVTPAAGITYQWLLNGVAIPGATQHDYTIQANGCYRQTIYEGTCESTSNEICITNTSLQESGSSLVSIYPHPVTSQSVMINPFNAGSLTQLSWYDVSGKLVAEDSRIAEREMLLHTEHLKSGIYFLEIRNASFQEVIRKKVIIQ